MLCHLFYVLIIINLSSASPISISDLKLVIILVPVDGMALCKVYGLDTKIWHISFKVPLVVANFMELSEWMKFCSQVTNSQ